MFEGIKLFETLSEDDLKNLALFCQERTVQEWEVLFQQWDESNSMYVVKNGLLQASTYEKILGTIQSGEIVGEMAVFNEPQHRMASVKALQKSDLIVIISYSLEQLVKKHPNIVQKIQTVIEERKKKNEWKN